MTSVDLQIEEGSPAEGGRPRYRLSDEEYRRLSQLGQEAEEQTVEATLRQEAAERKAVEDARAAIAQQREALPRAPGKRSASTVAGGVAAIMGKQQRRGRGGGRSTGGGGRPARG